MASKDAIQVIEPATEQVMAELPRAGAEETDAAIEGAKAAFPAWRAIDPADRSALLRGLADAIEDRKEDLAQLEARNAGKPISDARGEMGMVVETFRYYAGAPERLTGKTIPVAGGVDMTFREPLGVVGLITPWNFPLTIASWKIAPALAAGNTIVLKPAELTPLTAVELERIAVDAGLPEIDAALKGGDFFAVDRYPRVTYSSTSISEKAGDQVARGTLTMKGRSRSLDTPFRVQHEGADVVISGVLTLNRLDYGIGTGDWSNTKWLGAEVRVSFRATLAQAASGASATSSNRFPTERGSARGWRQQREGVQKHFFTSAQNGIVNYLASICQWESAMPVRVATAIRCWSSCTSQRPGEPPW